MAAIPNPTVDAIWAHYEAKPQEDRNYFGGSDIGEPCMRKLWYKFRHAKPEKHSGRMLRLFETGHQQEARVIADLRAIGVTVWDKDPATGEQFRYTQGHISCGLDGVVLGLPDAPKTPHLLEVKTHNEKSFLKLEKDGPPDKHMAQMQIYMHMADLTRAAYFGVNKNTDDIYMVRIEYDAKQAKALMLKAQRVITASTPLERISEDPAFWLCKFCHFSGICHGRDIPRAVCGTCLSADADGGKWSCAKGLGMAPECTEHLYVPALIGNHKEPEEHCVTYEKFSNVAGQCFPAPEGPCYSSQELQNCTLDVPGNPEVERVRAMGGRVESSNDLTTLPTSGS